jgi:hypothetical protein
MLGKNSLGISDFGSSRVGVGSRTGFLASPMASSNAVFLVGYERDKEYTEHQYR